MFTVHRAERADTLVGALTELLATPPSDVFAPDVIAVPAKGVERWLAQQLSQSLGVAANIAFPHPSDLVAGAVAGVQGIDPDDDPWSPGRLVWTLLEVIDDCTGEPWCAMLARHLGVGDEEQSHRRGRRYSTAESLARLFTAYAENRPGMLVDWAAGGDSDGAGGSVDPDLRWQVQLWRRLRERIGTPSTAERLTDTCATLAADPSVIDLPARLSLFGATRLTRAQLAVLEALAVHRDVHLWLTHPSPAMWDKLARRPAPQRRADDDSALAVDHPLLASLAREIRELQHRLPGADVHHPGQDPASGVLAAVRADIAADRPPGSAGRVPNDDSIQIHACHGAARQVEVLREALLGLLAADDTLQPRDIIVMCPDVDTYAPLIAAAFGQPDVAEHPGHQLRVRLADRSPALTNPLLDVVSTLLHLADGRVTASEVLDLAAREPVARCFGFAGDDLETLRRWTVTAGARWGLGPRQRAAHGLAGVPQNTFDTALNRLLLGVAADETDLAWLGLALPLDDVDSSDVDLAGRFAEYVDRLGAVLDRLTGEHPAPEWTATLTWALDMLTKVPATQTWQRLQATRELTAATEHAGDVRLRLPDVRAMLARRLAGRPTRSNFRTGEMTVCTLVPMRSVPHRVVAVIGLDDDAFPRTTAADGDDVLARDPCLGEREPRSEDRQLLLDAILAATEHLIVCYTGADPVTGATRPPAAPLAELVDVVKATVIDPEQVVTRQPLQPFDPANFVPPEPFSFDRHAFSGALASRDQAPAPRLLEAPLPATTKSDVDLDDLVAFFRNPARAFLRQRLDVTVTDPADDVDDALPLAVEGLHRWQIGDRMLTAVLAGADPEALCQAELRRGTLPAGRLGSTALGAIRDSIIALHSAATQYLRHPPTSVDVAVDLPDGRRLTGTVPDVRDKTLVTVQFSALAPQHRFAAWLRLLAVAATTGEPDWQAVTIGPRQAGAPTARRSALTAPSDPEHLLQQLVDVYDKGLCEPLPLAPKTAEKYVSRRMAGESVTEAMADARVVWTTTRGGYGENSDAAVRYLHGPDMPFAELWATPPGADERWYDDEPSRFGALARRIWEPMLIAETAGLV